MSSFSYYNSEARLASNIATGGGVNPVLAKLYFNHGIAQGDIQALENAEREGLCRNVIELIESTDRQTEREMAADILLSLLKNAELQLKQSMVERLALIEDAPLRLVLQFINERIDIAEPLLKYSKALNDLDLIYIIQSRDSPFWQAIATRQELGNPVVEALVETKDPKTSKNLIENENVSWTDHVLEKLVSFSEGEPVLTEALLNRSQSVGGEFAKKIFTYAGEQLKLALQQELKGILGGGEDISPVEQPVMMRHLADVLSEFTEPDYPTFLPTPSMVKVADMFAEQGKLTVDLMITTLKRGQAASFIAQFSRFSGLPVPLVVPMIQQKSGQGFALAAKSIGVERSEFLMMYNFIRKIMGEDYLSAKDLSATLSFYDRLTPEIAKRLMKSGRH